MYNFKKKILNLKNPLSFWQAFSGKDIERIFFYDPQSERLVIAAERLTALKSEAEIKNFPYSFYSRTFFNENSENEWAGLGNELLAFKHYFVKSKSESHYDYFDEAREIADIEIPDFHHVLRQEPENLSAWESFFSEIKRNISTGRVKKVVASRQVIFEIESNDSFHIESILQKLIENNPNCFVFAYQKAGRIFFGASPELLVRKNGSKISSYALAGTLSKFSQSPAQELLKDPKNLQEHAIVVNTIKERLGNTNDLKIHPTGLLELKNVWHLQTKIETSNSDKSLIDWAELLHPTPALGGDPSEVALELIRNYESYPRGLYASPLGMIEAQGNGCLIVAIRSALIENQRLHVYAGAGIVADSQLESESFEISTKLQTILEVL